MNRTKIETFDYTWNPVTGCLKGCEYCYAKPIAERFKKESFGTIYENGLCQADIDDTFPKGFAPTFYPHRLRETYSVKKPSRIFVCSMADLLGEWVPREWIQQVIEATKAAPQHTYFFLTKNPARYQEFTWPDNCWLGTTVESTVHCMRFFDLYQMKGKARLWLSMEPFLSANYTFQTIDWVIVGAMTGPGAKNHQPRLETLKEIRRRWFYFGTPLFMKNSLADIWSGELIKELPVLSQVIAEQEAEK